MTFFASWLRETSLSKKYRGLIADWPSYQTIPTGRSLFRLKLWLRVISSFFSAFFRLSFSDLYRMYLSTKITGTQKGQVLVLANGPSVRQLSRQQLHNFVNSGGKIIAMNGYVYSDLADEFPPDFYFVADPDIWLQPLPNDYKFQQKLEQLIAGKWGETIIVQPIHQTNIARNHKRYIYLTHLNTSGFLPFKNPFFVWGLVPSTALLALAVAKKVGFERIFFAGLDGDSYRHFYVDQQGTLRWENLDHHFYSAELATAREVSQSSFQGIYVDPKLTSTIGDALYAEAILRRDFMRLSNGEFINATPSKYFDLGKKGGDFIG